MIIRINGGSSGIAEYLEHGQKSGRNYSRDELDYRLPLSGNLDQLDNVLSQFDEVGEFEKYMHITLSFKERHIDEQVLKEINQKFHDFILTACKEEEFYFYSEAHLPKIKALMDKNGNAFERFPHIHVVIPEFNLLTGKRENHLGKRNNILHYFDAFQEAINRDYGLESPKDNLRELSFGKEEIIGRNEISPDLSVKEIKERLFLFVLQQPSITSVEELAVAIRHFGLEAKARDSKKFGAKYINFRFKENGKAKAINLKDPVFLDVFLKTRDKALAKEFLCGKDKDNSDELLQDWQDYKALEARFLGRQSPKFRTHYHGLSVDEQKAWTQKQWQDWQKGLMVEDEKNANTSVVTVNIDDFYQSYQDLDAIPHIDDLPHLDDLPHIEDSIYADKEREGQHDLHAVQSFGGDGSTRQRGDVVDADLLLGHSFNGLERSQEAQYTDLFVVRGQGRRGRDRVEDVNARHEGELWSDKINAINTRTLLDFLSYRYHLHSEYFQITRNRAGHERIICADNKDKVRRYSASDFLTKYMHLSWNEAKGILTEVLEQQQQGGYRAQAINSRLLWNRFQRYEESLEGLKGLAERYRNDKKSIYQRLGFVYDLRLTRAQNVVKRRLYRTQRQAELAELYERYKENRVYYLKRPEERYINYLQNEAEQGNALALAELQRVYPRYKRDDNVFTIELNDKKRPLPPFKPLDLGYEVKIQKNGTVEYRENDKRLISDTYQSIKVHERHEDVLVKALEIAKARYGVNGFEIKNARKEDLEVIQRAVNRTGVKVTVKSINNKGLIK